MRHRKYSRTSQSHAKSCIFFLGKENRLKKRIFRGCKTDVNNFGKVAGKSENTRAMLNTIRRGVTLRGVRLASLRSLGGMPHPRFPSPPPSPPPPPPCRSPPPLRISSATHRGESSGASTQRTTGAARSPASAETFRFSQVLFFGRRRDLMTPCQVETDGRLGS